MIIRKEIDITEPLPAEELKMLEKTKNQPVVPDEDRPELTDEQLSQLNLASERKDYSVTLRLSPQTLQKARSLGKSYPSILSQLLEKILNNNELLKQCM